MVSAFGFVGDADLKLGKKSAGLRLRAQRGEASKYSAENRC